MSIAKSLCIFCFSISTLFKIPVYQNARYFSIGWVLFLLAFLVGKIKVVEKNPWLRLIWFMVKEGGWQHQWFACKKLSWKLESLDFIFINVFVQGSMWRLWSTKTLASPFGMLVVRIRCHNPDIIEFSVVFWVMTNKQPMSSFIYYVLLWDFKLL